MIFVCSSYTVDQDASVATLMFTACPSLQDVRETSTDTRRSVVKPHSGVSVGEGVGLGVGGDVGTMTSSKLYEKDMVGASVGVASLDGARSWPSTSSRTLAAWRMTPDAARRRLLVERAASHSRPRPLKF